MSQYFILTLILHIQLSSCISSSHRAYPALWYIFCLTLLSAQYCCCTYWVTAVMWIVVGARYKRCKTAGIWNYHKRRFAVWLAEQRSWLASKTLCLLLGVGRLFVTSLFLQLIVSFSFICNSSLLFIDFVHFITSVVVVQKHQTFH